MLNPFLKSKIKNVYPCVICKAILHSTKETLWEALIWVIPMKNIYIGFDHSYEQRVSSEYIF